MVLCKLHIAGFASYGKAGYSASEKQNLALRTFGQKALYWYKKKIPLEKIRTYFSFSGLQLVIFINMQGLQKYAHLLESCFEDLEVKKPGVSIISKN